MQKFENVEKIINKEINFLNGSEKLIEENYEELVDFSSKFYNAEKRVKDKNLDKGVRKAIEEELIIEFDNNLEIKNFCEVNFNISFPMTSIYDVKGDNAHDIYKWAKKNHGKSAIPKWNFYKILINKEGKIEETFNSFTKPTSKRIISKIEKLLN